MTDTKCPRCGAEMEHVAINYLGYSDNGHHYECPNCEYAEYIKPMHKHQRKSMPLEYIEAAREYVRTERMSTPHIYGGEIVGVWDDDGETYVKVKLDNPSEQVSKTHVSIIDAERVFV